MWSKVNTVLPATRQRWHSHLYPSQSWYSIKWTGGMQGWVVRVSVLFVTVIDCQLCWRTRATAVTGVTAGSFTCHPHVHTACSMTTSSRSTVMSVAGPSRTAAAGCAISRLISRASSRWAASTRRSCSSRANSSSTSPNSRRRHVRTTHNDTEATRIATVARWPLENSLNVRWAQVLCTQM